MPPVTRRTGRGPGSRARPTDRPRLQQALHLDDVEPATEFASDFALGADDLEAACAVQRDRRFVVADDAGDHGVEAVGRGEGEQLLENATADALTLAALVDWSYDLLTASERTLFNRLAVFAAGFTLRAAETVCAGESIKQPEIIGLLTQLIAKSLIVADGTSAAAERLARVLTNDPGSGVMRHADAGYDTARECAREKGLQLPMVF